MAGKGSGIFTEILELILTDEWGTGRRQRFALGNGGVA
jgi:hypothetical protein